VRKSSRLESSQPRSERKVLPSRLRGASGLAPKDQTPPYEVRWGLASRGTVTEAIYEAGSIRALASVQNRPICST
jgi:hypothetical protein